MNKASAVGPQGEEIQVHYDETPDTCPICHHALIPRTAGLAFTGEPREGILQVFYQCTRLKCGMGFVGLYQHRAHRHSNDYYALRRVWPRTAAKARFGDEVTKLSPTFVAVHNQAIEAEASELDQIAGIGFRKALEFLVKDYAIHENPGDQEKIRSSFLGKVIKDYVADPNVQRCAERAAWLGNDEAHYIRKWEDKDIEDLKLLLRLTVNWIENSLLTERYVAEMLETDSVPITVRPIREESLRLL